MLTLKKYSLLKDLVLLTIAMFIGSLGWAIFLLPNHITTGGIPGLKGAGLAVLSQNAVCSSDVHPFQCFRPALDGGFNTTERPTLHGYRARCRQLGQHRGPGIG